jgi:hypothetical protein
MFTQRKNQFLTLTIRVYTVAIGSVNKIVTNEWLRLNFSGFLMYYLVKTRHTTLSQHLPQRQPGWGSRKKQKPAARDRRPTPPWWCSFWMVRPCRPAVCTIPRANFGAQRNSTKVGRKKWRELSF